MRTSTLRVYSAVACLVALAPLSACDNLLGVQGPPGADGTPGAVGPIGPRGLPGADALRSSLTVVVGGADSVIARAECPEDWRLLSGSCQWGKNPREVFPWRETPILNDEGEPYAFECEGAPTNIQGAAPSVVAYAICEGFE